MGRSIRVALASDIHYACAAEQARGDDYEQRIIRNPALRILVRLYRRFYWARAPLRVNYLLDHFIASTQAEHAIICGDLTCDTGFSGVSDPAALESARECLGKLRERFGSNLDVSYGDHELGKKSFMGGRGGMRFESLEKLRGELGLPDFWIRQWGRWVAIGISSSLVALPAFESETISEERARWREVRRDHMRKIANAFQTLAPESKVLLFCHDPTALPFLLEEAPVRERLGQIQNTIIGHLHSNLILKKGRALAGMPQIRFLGHTASKLTAALRQARLWKPFKVMLCPALAGIQLLKDGGYYEMALDLSGDSPPVYEFRPLELRQ